MAGRYDKVHIVPFGEFIPLNDTFPVIGELVGMGRNLTPGKAFRPLDLTKDVRAGVMICYEDVFAYAARELVRNGANFLLVITNDAWYPTSTEPEQHYANAVLRTVETRLPMLRCGNSNYSVLIDQFGRTVDSVTKRIDPETGDARADAVGTEGRRGRHDGESAEALHADVLREIRQRVRDGPVGGLRRRHGDDDAE